MSGLNKIHISKIYFKLPVKNVFENSLVFSPKLAFIWSKYSKLCNVKYKVHLNKLECHGKVHLFQ